MYTWTCDYCDTEIADGTGHLEVLKSDARKHRESEAAFDARHADDIVFDLADWLESVAPKAHWRGVHMACDPWKAQGGPASGYSIPVAEIRDAVGLVNWTSHLLEKEWLADTDWRQVMLSAKTQDQRAEVTA